MALGAKAQEALDSFMDFVQDGAYDKQLQDINRGLVERIKAVRALEASKATMTIRVGMNVELHGLAPKWLNGLKGTVTEKGRGTRVTVQLDEKSGDLYERKGSPFGPVTGKDYMRRPRVPAQCCKQI